MAEPKIRKPCVAGQFYPSDPKELKKLIDFFLKDLSAPLSKVDALGCILPHAGYIYSGRVAVETVARLKIRDTVILLGPNHTGIGPLFSIMAGGAWQTPLGNLEIDSGLAELFLKNSSLLEKDVFAHQDEHSLEVELPILEYFRSDFKFVPIAIMSNNFNSLKALGGELAAVIKENRIAETVTIVASSDMTHYESQESAEKKDRLAIEAILRLDSGLLMRTIKDFDISMCGFAPVIVFLEAAKQLGATRGELIKYQTSAMATGDRSSVVGYAGITIN